LPRGGSSRPSRAGPLAAGAMLAALALLIGLASYYLPVVGSALVLVTPLPAAVAAVRYGTRVAALTAVVATLIAFPLSGPLGAVFILSGCSMGVSLGHGMSRGWRVSRTLLVGAVTFAATLALTIIVSVQVLGPATLATMSEGGVIVLRTVAGASRAVGRIADAEALESIVPIIQQHSLLVVALSAVPGGFCWAFIWYGVCAPVLRRLGHAVPEPARPAPVARWSLPPALGVALLLVLVAATLLLPRVTVGSTGAVFTMVLLSLVSLAFVLQGTGLAAYLITGLGLAAPLRRLLIFATFVGAMTQPALYRLAFFGGMFDLALGYRSDPRVLLPRGGRRRGQHQVPGLDRETVSSQGEEFRRGESVKRRLSGKAGAGENLQEKGE